MAERHIEELANQMGRLYDLFYSRIYDVLGRIYQELREIRSTLSDINSNIRDISR